jgi:hypothetical protein
MKKLLLIASLFVVFYGCKDDDGPTPSNEVMELNVEFHHTFNGQPLELDTTDYTMPSGEEVRFKRLSYLLSNFYMVKENGDKVMLDKQYAFLNVSKFHTFTLTDVPQGSYTAFGFNIGLDSNENHGDPNRWPLDHPLNPVKNSLLWDWAGGYIFTAIEGQLADGTDNFVFHLAGDQFKTAYEIPVNYTKGEEAASIHLEYMLDEIFQNPEIYSLEKDGLSTHTIDNPITAKLVGNMGDQIKAYTN